MQILHIQPRENIIPIDSWQDYARDGEQFLATVVAAHDKGRKAFSPEALYNLTAMAIEKFIMAFLMRRGDLAENHTMTDLATALLRHTGPIPGLAEKLGYLDSFQDICDLHQARYVPPSMAQVSTIIAIGQEIQLLLGPLLTEKETP